MVQSVSFSIVTWQKPLFGLYYQVEGGSLEETKIPASTSSRNAKLFKKTVSKQFHISWRSWRYLVIPLQLFISLPRTEKPPPPRLSSAGAWTRSPRTRKRGQTDPSERRQFQQRCWSSPEPVSQEKVSTPRRARRITGEAQGTAQSPAARERSLSSHAWRLPAPPPLFSWAHTQAGSKGSQGAARARAAPHRVAPRTAPGVPPPRSLHDFAVRCFPALRVKGCRALRQVSHQHSTEGSPAENPSLQLVLEISGAFL